MITCSISTCCWRIWRCLLTFWSSCNTLEIGTSFSCWWKSSTSIWLIYATCAIRFTSWKISLTNCICFTISDLCTCSLFTKTKCRRAFHAKFIRIRSSYTISISSLKFRTGKVCTFKYNTSHRWRSSSSNTFSTNWCIQCTIRHDTCFKIINALWRWCNINF
jgi:hypothetical protein